MTVKENSPQILKIVTIGAFLAFLLFGFSDNLKGATLPVLLDAIENLHYAIIK